jgi:hypothetical protein
MALPHRKSIRDRSTSHSAHILLLAAITTLPILLSQSLFAFINLLPNMGYVQVRCVCYLGEKRGARMGFMIDFLLSANTHLCLAALPCRVTTYRTCFFQSASYTRATLCAVRLSPMQPTSGTSPECLLLLVLLEDQHHPPAVTSLYSQAALKMRCLPHRPECTACLYPASSTILSGIFFFIYLLALWSTFDNVARAALNYALRRRLRALQGILTVTLPRPTHNASPTEHHSLRTHQSGSELTHCCFGFPRSRCWWG